MNTYPYTPLYYSNPTRLKYYDADFNCWLIGIGIADKIITFDGQYVDTAYIISRAEANHIYWDNAIIECSWENLF